MSLVKMYFWRLRSCVLVSCLLIFILIIIISFKKTPVLDNRLPIEWTSRFQSVYETQRGGYVTKARRAEESKQNRTDIFEWTMPYDEYCRSKINDTLYDKSMVIPDDKTLKTIPLQQLACFYNRYISSIQSLCHTHQFLGQIHTGGVMVCSDAEIKPNGSVLFFEHDIPDFQMFLYDFMARFSPKVTYFYIERPLENTTIPPEFYFRQIQGTLSKEIDETVLSLSLSDWMKKVSADELQIFTFSVREETLTAFEDFVSSSAINHIKILVIKLHYDHNNYTTTGLTRRLTPLRRLYEQSFRIYWFDRSFHCAIKSSKSKFNDCFTVCLIQQEELGKTRDTLKNSEHTESYVLPLVSAIPILNEQEAEVTYQNYLTTLQYHCKQFVRIGRNVDGGWEVCLDRRYLPGESCLVYSFGIKDDWSFDEEMSNYYHCEVNSFDPSLDIQNHTHTPGVHFYNIGLSSKDKIIPGMVYGNESKRLGNWTLRTLQSILLDLGHLNRTIDVIKIDIEGTEWGSIPNMISSGILSNVKQFLVEFHGQGDVASLRVLRMLYDIGFRIYWMHRNPACQNDGHLIPICSCFEIYFVNTHF
ncbi:hypothetical protein FSP39_015005 [Pinctada imbricata]|uniref:Methyltransferase domain-containing protein n=1 Tax=Pinctada imbricata TaxID=66713 RepID=A0AA89C6L4_PINIB|nr:hypothetical protein FSP39_015005 [Pinctada imbricata]